MEKNFTPGVRFYFVYEDIINHPRYSFDGYHPAKIKDELILADYLYACIVPEQYKDTLENMVQHNIADKLFYLPQNNLGKWDWPEKAYDFVCSIRKGIVGNGYANSKPENC